MSLGLQRGSYYSWAINDNRSLYLTSATYTDTIYRFNASGGTVGSYTIPPPNPQSFGNFSLPYQMVVDQQLNMYLLTITQNNYSPLYLYKVSAARCTGWEIRSGCAVVA